MYAVGGISQDIRNAHGEIALLLDTLDLVLHTALASPAFGPESPHLSSSDDSSKSCANEHLHTSELQAGSNSSQASDSDGAQSLSQDLTECCLWGLHVLVAAAKQTHAAHACTKVLREYMLERIVLFSRDWPIAVGQAAVQVYTTTHA